MGCNKSKSAPSASTEVVNPAYNKKKEEDAAAAAAVRKAEEEEEAAAAARKAEAEAAAAAAEAEAARLKQAEHNLARVKHRARELELKQLLRKERDEQARLEEEEARRRLMLVTERAEARLARAL